MIGKPYSERLPFRVLARNLQHHRPRPHLLQLSLMALVSGCCAFIGLSTE